MNAHLLPVVEGATLFSRERRGACIGATALVSLLAFESIAVATAMPAIAASLAGLRLYALAFGGMLATSVLGMVLAGRWCDWHGPVRAAVMGLVTFFCGLLLAGFAPTMSWLVAGRIAQGLGSGMLGVALYVGMGHVVPPALHPRLFALFAAAWVLPGLLGPVAAAWLVERWGWRAVFLVVAAAVPLAAALVLPAFARLPRPHGPTADASASHHRVAWAAAGAAGALLLNAASRADTPTTGVPLLIAGLITVGLAASRLLPRGSLTAAPGLPAVIALRGLLAAAFATAEVFIPLYLTHEAGWSLAQAGMALSSGALLWSLGSAVQARIVSACDRRRGLQAGFVGVAVGIALVMAQVMFDGPAWTVFAAWAVAGFGIGLGFPMLSVLTLGLSAPSEQGRNASALQLSDALCSSAALAVAGTLFGLAGDSGRLGHTMVLASSATTAALGAWLARRAFN